jgi:hypothetical protein
MKANSKKKNMVTDMGDEAQYAVWYWVVPPASPLDSSSTEEQPENVGWHPCFALPANRYVFYPSSFTSHHTIRLPLDIPLFLPISYPLYAANTQAAASSHSLLHLPFPQQAPRQPQRLLSPSRLTQAVPTNAHHLAATTNAYPGPRCRRYVRRARTVWGLESLVSFM